jgi:Flp pilus assembly protein TadG
MIRRQNVPSIPGDGPVERAKCARGQSLVEFALLLPVLVILMMIAVDVGRVYFATVSLHNVARIGANYAAQSTDGWKGTGNATMKTRYQTLMRRDARGLDCSLPTTLPAPTFVDSGVNAYSLGSRVRVDLSCRFQLLSPFLYGLVGDSTGGVQVTASTTFPIRSGSVEGVIIGGPSASSSPTPSPSPTWTIPIIPLPTATPATSIDPNATPTPQPTPTPVLIVSFHGSSTSIDASGGGPPGSDNENQIVGVPPVVVTFSNTTQGLHGSCLWEFGDGSTSTSCGSTVSRTYSTRGTFTVRLTVQDKSLTRTAYVLVGCKVPAFAGVRKNSAVTNWTSAGFGAANLTTQTGSGNYRIGYQSLAGGLVNPPGGCSGATVVVGP